MPGMIEISILVGFLVIMGLISFNVESILRFFDKDADALLKKSKH